MEGRRTTRGRPKRKESPVVTTSSSKRSDTISTRSPGRRSSRPRSSASVNTVTISSDPIPLIIEDEKEEVVISSSKSINSLPATRTTNTGSLASSNSFLTSSVFSSNSTTTQKVTETRTSKTVVEQVNVTSKLRERTLSKDAIDIPIIRDRSHTPTTNTEAGGSRYSRSVSRSIYEDDDNISRGGFSDNDAIPEGEEEQDGNEHYLSFDTNVGIRASPYYRSQVAPKEFGGWLGVFILMKMVPFLIYYLQWSCKKRSCEFKEPNWNAITDVDYLTSEVFKPAVVAAYIGYFFTIVILSAILFGRQVRLYADRIDTTRVFNAPAIAMVLTVALVIAEYFQYSVVNFILTYYLRFCLYGLLTAFIMAFWTYLGSLYKNKEGDGNLNINVYGNTGNFLVDFALGRQINPKWLGFIDIKQTLFRMSLMSTYLLAFCYAYNTLKIPSWPVEKENDPVALANYYWANITFNAPTLLSSTLLLIYCSQTIIFEHHLASSFLLQAEGMGLLLMLRYAATPFVLAAPVRYFALNRCNLDNIYVVIATLVLFSFGFILKLFSSAMKYKYRVDPLDSFFTHVPSILTFQGKRLLLGPFWGRIRQPNYAGEILMLLAFSIPLISQKAWLPLIGLGLMIVQLIHRIERVNAHNTARYHSSWLRYCNTVRYRILPKVF